jgi:hypothetical protein
MPGNLKQPGSCIYNGTEFSLLTYCPEEGFLYQIISISLITRLSE